MGYSPWGQKESDTTEPLNKEQVNLSQLTTSLFASLDKKKILGKKAILIILIFLFFILFFSHFRFWFHRSSEMVLLNITSEYYLTKSIFQPSLNNN